MTIIVQKFGGTSLGGGERLRNVADIIARTRNSHEVVAVVSALSRTEKSKGTTSLLLEGSEAAARGKPFASSVDALETNHLAVLEQAVSGKRLRDEVRRFIGEELRRVRGYLEAIEVIRELSPRSQDILLATGERLSAHLLTATLRDRKVGAECIDLTFVVPDGEDEPDPPFFKRLQERLAKRCRPRDGKVPIVTGFFGLVPGGLLRTVGRGYTDFTAALISAGLGSKATAEMQVWKDVEGVFSADPRRVPNARVLPTITPMEASELTYFGAEVLHPLTMERVVAAKIPIRVKNTLNPAGAGTLILEAGPDPEGQVRAVTAKGGVAIFTVQSNRMYNAHGFMARVFNVLEKHRVAVDLIATSEVSICCTVDDLDDIERAREELELLGTISVTPGRAILAMVGEGMKFAVGTAGRMFTTLGAAGINIEMISQGASEINISCVIKEEDAERGLRAVHKVFLEGG